MLSFIKSLFSSKKEKSKVIIKHKWAINPIKIYIAPLNFANYDDCKIKYRDMVVKAFNIWANASGLWFCATLSTQSCPVRRTLNFAWGDMGGGFASPPIYY